MSLLFSVIMHLACVAEDFHGEKTNEHPRIASNGLLDRPKQRTAEQQQSPQDLFGHFIFK